MKPMSRKTPSNKRPVEQRDHKAKHGRVAVKIVDDRGIESLKILELGG